MRHRKNTKSRAYVRLGLLLACALTALAMPTLYNRFAGASAAGRDGKQDQIQSIQVPSIPAGQAYRQTNLISDTPGLAPVLDPLLVNPWGITVRLASPFWIANNQTSTTQLVRGDVGGAPVVLNPTPPGPQTVGIPGGRPTGAVGNTSTTDFKITPPGGGAPASASFIFDSETGNITAWNGASGSTAQLVVSNPCHRYTGLASGSNSGGSRLYAADFKNNRIDVFDQNFNATTVTGGFSDGTIPSDYRPFNIQNLGGSLYVTYAKSEIVAPTDCFPDEVNGAGFGYVRKFNTDGVRDLTFAINNGQLDAPWGLAIAPAPFGLFGGKLLVGNFSDNGIISAYDPSTGAAFIPGGSVDNVLRNEAGQPIVIDELWALQFGNGSAGGDANTLYFTSGFGEEEHGLLGKLNPTTATATSLIQFATDNFAVDEAGGHVDFTVVRTGDTSGTATVNYNTFDEPQAGHAGQKTDYEISLGTLTFNPGETSKTFRVLIVDDKFVEGDETISLALSNPTGAGVGLGSPNTAELTILDNDATPTTANPIDDPTFFVRQHYLDFYNREPDANAPALAAQITACGSNAACVAGRRRDVSAAFFTSNEFFGNGSLIERAYKAAFGNNPASPGAPLPVLYGEFELDIQALLKDVAIGSAGAAQLEANKVAYYNSFVARPRFVAAHSSQTNAQYVDSLIANSGVTFPAGFRDQEVGALDASTKTRAQVLRDIAEDAAFAQQEVARVSVMLGFFAYDRRDPDAAGFAATLSRVNAFGGDFQRAGLINIFIQSSEYNQRFGAAGGRNTSTVSSNTAPTANNDTASTNAATPVSINVLANDTDPEGDYLTVQSVAPGAGGTPSISPDGRSVTFTPAAGFAGTATFQYTATDNGYNCGSPGCGPFSGITPNPLTSTATVSVTVSAGGTFQFNASTAAVSEGDGKVTLTVTLSGGSTSGVTVDYATTPDSSVQPCAAVTGQASERCDYETAIGTLRFAPGESTKTFDVFITDDARVEGPETFTVSLSNPTGGATFSLGSAASTTVTIADNDTSPAAANPIDNTQFFVKQQYRDFLNRDPDAAGFNAWVITIMTCAASDTTCDRVAVSSKFFFSDEFQSRGYFAIRFYRAAFGRNPTFREFVGDLSRLSGATTAETNALNAQFPSDFVQRPEFVSTYGSLTNAQYVDKLIANTGVSFPSSTRDQWVAALNGGMKTRAQVLREVVEASQFVTDQATFNRAFVLTEYFGFLRRDPDAAGFNNWVATLNANPSAFRAMVSGFVNSTEYRLRFGNP